MTSTSRRRSGRIAAVVALVLCAGVAAGAQSLRVQVTEEQTGRPLAGAVAEVLDAADVVVAQGMLSAEGRRVLAVGSAGTYRVRIRRIGYTPFIGQPLVVTGAGSAEVVLRAPDRRVVLAPIDVRAASVRRCARDAFADPGFVGLWEQVRTALTVTALSRAEAPSGLEVRAFHREINPSGALVDERVGLPRTTTAARPYVTRSAAYLSANGYVQAIPDGAEFYAPDEQVLLSDEFITDHCFGVARGTDATDGLFGIRFNPADRRHGNDIAGTLWVDSASAELRYLDFWYEYAGLPRTVAGEGRTGGQVVFERLPSGAWIVSAWRLRLPHVRPAVADGRHVAMARDFTGGYDETGGVVNLRADDSTPPPPVLISYRDLLAPARISGLVYDSLAGQPLVGAQVWLVPLEPPDAVAAGLVPAGGRLAVSPVVDTADATGRFTIGGIPSGMYRLAFEHPALDAIGVRPPAMDIRLRPGGTVLGNLAVPSLGTLAAGCALPTGRSTAAHDGIVMGVVSSAADGRPLANAVVRMSWNELSRTVVVSSMMQAYEVETRTDTLGYYRLCGVPDSTIAVVQAAGPRSTTGRMFAQTGPLHVTRLNLRLAEVDSGQPAPAPGTIVGTVTDSLGRPQAGVVVTVDNAAVDARTDDEGRFRLSGIQAGSQVVEVKRVGLAMSRHAVEVVPGETTVAPIVLGRAQRLDALVVTAERSRRGVAVADAVRRHRNGTGMLLLEEQLKGRRTMRSLLEGLSGVRTALAPDGSSGDWVAMMRVDGGECVARLFVDGHEQDYDYLHEMSVDDVAALEVFVRAGVAPLFTMGHSIYGRLDNCGSLVFWTKR